jgi:GxxExxY protein
MLLHQTVQGVADFSNFGGSPGTIQFVFESHPLC